MSKRLVLEPKGWPCCLGEAYGLCLYDDETLIVRTAHGDSDAYIAEDGQAFWGGTNTKIDRAQLMVQPVVAKWVGQ